MHFQKNPLATYITQSAEYSTHDQNIRIRHILRLTYRRIYLWTSDISVCRLCGRTTFIWRLLVLARIFVTSLDSIPWSERMSDHISGCGVDRGSDRGSQSRSTLVPLGIERQSEGMSAHARNHPHGWMFLILLRFASYSANKFAEKQHKCPFSRIRSPASVTPNTCINYVSSTCTNQSLSPYQLAPVGFLLHTSIEYIALVFLIVY